MNPKMMEERVVVIQVALCDVLGMVSVGCVREGGLP